MVCFLPYGATLLTISYGVFCYFVLNEMPECTEDECRTEGVDNATINWATDLFIFGSMGLLALHLLCSYKIYNGFTTILYMSIAYAFSAIGHQEYGNNGTGDGKGELGFYLAWLVSYFFLTDSLISFAAVTSQVYDGMASEDIPRYCGKFELAAFQLFVTLSFLMIGSGCVWCAISEDVLVDLTLDNYPTDPATDEPLCVQLIVWGEGVYVAAYALFWFVAATILGSAAKYDTKSLMGLPNSLAAAGIIVMQLITGVVFLSFYMLENSGYIMDHHRTAGSILYHYSMLMTGFLAHTLIVTVLGLEPSQKARNNKTESESDDEQDWDIEIIEAGQSDEEGCMSEDEVPVVVIVSTKNKSKSKMDDQSHIEKDSVSSTANSEEDLVTGCPSCFEPLEPETSVAVSLSTQKVSNKMITTLSESPSNEEKLIPVASLSCNSSTTSSEASFLKERREEEAFEAILEANTAKTIAPPEQKQPICMVLQSPAQPIIAPEKERAIVPPVPLESRQQSREAVQVEATAVSWWDYWPAANPGNGQTSDVEEEGTSAITRDSTCEGSDVDTIIEVDNKEEDDVAQNIGSSSFVSPSAVMDGLISLASGLLKPAEEEVVFTASETEQQSHGSSSGENQEQEAMDWQQMENIRLGRNSAEYVGHNTSTEQQSHGSSNGGNAMDWERIECQRLGRDSAENVDHGNAGDNGRNQERVGNQDYDWSNRICEQSQPQHYSDRDKNSEHGVDLDVDRYTLHQDKYDWFTSVQSRNDNIQDPRVDSNTSRNQERGDDSQENYRSTPSRNSAAHNAPASYVTPWNSSSLVSGPYTIRDEDDDSELSQTTPNDKQRQSMSSSFAGLGPPPYASF